MANASNPLLTELVERLSGLDAALAKAERSHDAQALKAATKLMNLPIDFGEWGRIALSEASALKAVLQKIDRELHFEARKEAAGLLFFLGRIHESDCGGYPALIETLYQSERFPCKNDRFLQLRHEGRYRDVLQLSDFRSWASRQGRRESETDALLRFLADAILSPMLHEHQAMLLWANELLPLARFTDFIKALYLFLSGDLYALRRSDKRFLTRFFKEAYPNETLLQCVSFIMKADGKTIDRLFIRAKALYDEMATQFQALLNRDVIVGWRKTPIPLSEALLANHQNLFAIAEGVRACDGFLDEARRLNSLAEARLAELLQ